MGKERLLLENRQQHMEEMFDSELTMVVKAQRVEESLWRVERSLGNYEK